MQTTMDLFGAALQKQNANQWASDLNITRQTFSMAKKKKRLSPVLAGNIAIKLGADPMHWIAIAALEAEPESEPLARLKANVNRWRKL
ncbi:MAG: hypothetical protein WBK51_12480 [Polaromonas sp.]